MEDMVLISMERFKKLESIESIMNKENKVYVFENFGGRVEVYFSDDAISELKKLSLEEIAKYEEACERLNIKMDIKHASKGLLSRWIGKL
jgi:hypothetical protein